MFENNRQAANAPMVSGATLTEAATMTGGGTYDLLWGKATSSFTHEGAYHLLLSNIGAANIWIGTSSTVKGALLAPGSSLNLAVCREATVWGVRTAAVAGSPDLSCIVFR
jgi:hypothetical protein